MEHKIGDRGLYRKLEAILGCAHRMSGQLENLEGLFNAVVMLNSLAFTYYKAHKRRGTEIVACSRHLIVERVGLCVELGLVDIRTGRLTKTGVRALEPGQFESVVSRTSFDYLRRKGFDMSLVEARISQQKSLSWLPTAQSLYELSNIDLSLPEFRRLLGLLAECNAMDVVQSRIYIPRGINR